MIIKRVSRGKVVPYSLKLAAALGGRGLTARRYDVAARLGALRALGGRGGFGGAVLEEFWIWF